ncbi:MAG TPA: cyclase family protein [Actinomycetota bacterium]|nr:cyclase family protein [Actinomycetota bacterium]
MCTEKCGELTRGAAAQRAGSRVSRRAALVGGAAVAATAALEGVAEAGERGHGVPGRGRRHGLVDLTHTLTTSFPAFSPGEEAKRETVVTIEDDGYYMQEWRIIEHIGTHVDAPGHFTPGGRLSPDLRPEELVVEAVVIDIADRAARDPDTVVTVDDLRAFERRHGRIPRNAAVLMDSGWAAKVGDAAAYRGADAAGTLHFPGFGPDACEWLLRRRGIRSLGVDTLSIDPGVSTTFETHLILTGADCYGLENLNNLGRIPKRGATIVVGLIPYEEGSGGQARIFASW